MSNTSLVELSASEQRIASRIDSGITNRLIVSGDAGGLGFSNASEAMEFAKLMAISSIAIPKHLRGNPGACLAITIQAVEWRMSPYAVANKSYSVNDRLAYESQLIQAVILQRAPIKGRFSVEYSGEGERRVCKVSASLIDGDMVEYKSPEFGKIQPKNSPLWKTDPDQQQFYYSGRALCRRHFPDVLLGVYDRDEIDIPPRDESEREVKPRRSLGERLDQLASATSREQSQDDLLALASDKHDPETGEITQVRSAEADTKARTSVPVTPEQGVPTTPTGAQQEAPAAADGADDTGASAEPWRGTLIRGRTGVATPQTGAAHAASAKGNDAK